MGGLNLWGYITLIPMPSLASLCAGRFLVFDLGIYLRQEHTYTYNDLKGTSLITFCVVNIYMFDENRPY